MLKKACLRVWWVENSPILGPTHLANFFVASVANQLTIYLDIARWYDIVFLRVYELENKKCPCGAAPWLRELHPNAGSYAKALEK